MCANTSLISNLNSCKVCSNKLLGKLKTQNNKSQTKQWKYIMFVVTPALGRPLCVEKDSMYRGKRVINGLIGNQPFFRLVDAYFYIKPRAED